MSLAELETGARPDPAALPAAGCPGAVELIQEMRELRRLDEPAGAWSVLARHPEVPVTKELLTDLACEEYSQLRAAGEEPDCNAFAAQFPGADTSLLKILVAREFVDDNPDVLPFDLDDSLPWPKPGDWVEGFGLRQELGRGSFARVFLAQQPEVADRHVVVKVSFSDADPEADALGRLNHPNIVPILSLHRDEEVGWTAVCMPYHGTVTLADVLERLTRGGGLPRRARAILDAVGETRPAVPPAREGAEPHALLRRGSYLDGALLLGAQLADAVAYVHEHKICHRDLKPANVLLTPSGRPLLLDFNLSCAEESADLDLGGSLPYMAPEQTRALLRKESGAGGGLDTRCDVYALGVILHQLLTGKHPFTPFPQGMGRRKLARWLLGRQQDGAAPVRQLNPGLDRAVARVLDRCLAHDPARRPSARELAEALRRALTPPSRAVRAVRAHPRALTGVAAAALTALGLTLFGLAQAGPAHVRSLQAGQQAYRAGGYAEAAGHFSRVLELEGPSARVLYARGRAHYRLGKYDRAIIDLLDARERGKDGKTYAALATCYLPDGQRNGYQSAVNYYREALGAGFQAARVYNNLGFAQAKLGQIAEARESFTQAIRLDPRLQAAYFNRACLSFRCRIPSAQGFLSVQPCFGQFLPVSLPVITLADAPGDWKRSLALLMDETIPDLEKALELGPESGELNLHAARAYALAAQLRPGLTGGKLSPDPDLSTQGLHHVIRALDLGCSADELRRDPLLHAGLGHLPGYRALRMRPAAGNVAARSAVRFLDPIDD
jgi:tetratricopeptide (TPR) repeat protein